MKNRTKNLDIKKAPEKKFNLMSLYLFAFMSFLSWKNFSIKKTSSLKENEIEDNFIKDKQKQIFDYQNPQSPKNDN